MQSEVERKECNICHEEKRITDFYFKSDRKTYDNTCKKCRIAGKKLPPKIDTGLKKCKHCGEEKPYSEYQKAGGGKWLQPYCKPCDKERKELHRQQNLDKYKQKHKENYLAKRVLASPERKEQLRLETAIRLRPFLEKAIANKMSEEERKRRKAECDRNYREKNKEAIALKKKQYKESGRALEVAKAWQKRKTSEDISYKIKKNLRSRVRLALIRCGAYKSASTEELLGCTCEEFKEYFCSLFTEGMTWDKYMKGEIVIDHKEPCKNFSLTDPEEQKRCFHFSNLQPLWKLQNLIKGIKTYDEWKQMTA